jgi:DNA ligase-1
MFHGTFTYHFHTTEKTFQDKHIPFIDVPSKEECKNQQHMHKFLQDIIDEGGEGIILRDPFSLYQPGRSLGFLKHKVNCFFV